jgi:hypothetical protein
MEKFTRKEELKKEILDLVSNIPGNRYLATKYADVIRHKVRLYQQYCRECELIFKGGF